MEWGARGRGRSGWKEMSVLVLHNVVMLLSVYIISITSKLYISMIFKCFHNLQVYEKTSRKQKMCGAVPEKNPIRSLSNVLYVRFRARDSSSSFIGKYTQFTGMPPAGIHRSTKIAADDILIIEENKA